VICNRTAFLALFLVTPIASGWAEPPGSVVGSDWWSGRMCVTGLSRLDPTHLQPARTTAADMAAAHGNLVLRRLLYRLPVTVDDTLSTILVRYPNLPPLLDRELKTASLAPPRVVPPDLLEVDMILSLPNLRRLLAAVLLGASSAETPRPPEERRPAARAVIVTPPGGTGFSPGLLPLLAARDAGRSARLKRLVADHCMAGGVVTYLLPEAAASMAERGTPNLTADAVGGVGKACLFFTDVDADRLVDALTPSDDGKDRPELCVVLPRPPGAVRTSSSP